MNKGIKIVVGIASGIVLLLLVGVIYFSVTFPKVGAPQEIEIVGTEAQTERGEYLANHVAVCIDCHSQRDFTKFAGPISPGTYGAGGELFSEEMGAPGTIYSKNITPAGIGEWTDGEILQAMTEGVSRDGTSLFPIMPYLNYNTMAESDARAIIAYLRTLDPIENEVPDRHLNFPLNLIVKTMPQPYNPQEVPDPADTTAYGEYLTHIASCTDCHTPLEGGQPVESMYLAGGRMFVMPNGDTVRSANITPHPITGIGAWTEDFFVERFKYFTDSSHQNIALEDTTTATIMPWIQYAGMTREDLRSVYRYLETIEPVDNPVVRYSPGE